MAEFEFSKRTTSERIVIDDFEITPAEAADLKSAVSFAGGMKTFPALPEKIKFGHFEIYFNEDGTLSAKRDDKPGEITFTFDLVDKLILAITSASNISINKKMLSPAPRAVGSIALFNSGDVIEGRD